MTLPNGSKVSDDGENLWENGYINTGVINYSCGYKYRGGIAYTDKQILISKKNKSVIDSNTVLGSFSLKLTI